MLTPPPRTHTPGAEVIGENMKDDADGDFNPMVPGKKTLAVFGFCDIRRYGRSRAHTCTHGHAAWCWVVLGGVGVV